MYLHGLRKLALPWGGNGCKIEGKVMMTIMVDHRCEKRFWLQWRFKKRGWWGSFNNRSEKRLVSWRSSLGSSPRPRRRTAGAAATRCEEDDHGWAGVNENVNERTRLYWKSICLDIILILEKGWGAWIRGQAFPRTLLSLRRQDRQVFNFHHCRRHRLLWTFPKHKDWPPVSVSPVSKTWSSL